VDTVLYFEGERHHSHRVVRAVKNRFRRGSELGVFEMTGEGLRAVANPSALFLAERPVNTPGSAVHCSMEGSRPLLVEVQALVSGSTFGNARRMASGVDQGTAGSAAGRPGEARRLNLVGEDVFVNVAGGMRLDEPAADLSVAAAVASSLRNRPGGRIHGRIWRDWPCRRGPGHHPGRPAGSRGCSAWLQAVYPASREH
jgi:DNA repair protein RadA/Sms